MSNNKRAIAHVNRNRHTADENMETLTGYLHTCLKMSDKPYINRSGQRSIFVKCTFPNGEREITVQQTEEATELLNDFMLAKGQFKRSDDTVSLRNQPQED